ncbi:MAG TPA: YciI family protein [Povalibacter sp.]|uniref:YciI family protein n=1 Tax=Povalibacter sp. TaxID=1962978 RepID=UPI002C670DF9|nr:YciI family protein [Povalibacter sp.]HMN45571.1 YciI family protein [Povalibacter sp.]
MKSFAILFHEDPSVLTQMSPGQMQEVVARYSTWFNTLRATGRVQISAKLKDDGGKHLQRQREQVVASDGPFAEAKDVVSGLFILESDSYESARATLADCPHFDFGWMELREIEFVK